MKLELDNYPYEYYRLTQINDDVDRFDFAKRTMQIYRRAVLNKNHYASTRTFRKGFIQSYLDFKRYYINN